MVIYGAGLGPSQLIQNQAEKRSRQYRTQQGDSLFQQLCRADPLHFGDTGRGDRSLRGHRFGRSGERDLPAAGLRRFHRPSGDHSARRFHVDQAGWGQAAATNVVDGTVNTPVNPAKIGDYISLNVTKAKPSRTAWMVS